MGKFNPSDAAVLRADMPAAPLGGTPEAGGPASHRPGFVVASHTCLFDRVDTHACDACGCTVYVDGDDRGDSEPADDDGYLVAGAGVYLWVRGDEVRRESVPLCASCASAIGMTALARWEIEEEEG